MTRKLTDSRRTLPVRLLCREKRSLGEAGAVAGSERPYDCLESPCVRRLEYSSMASLEGRRLLRSRSLVREEPVRLTLGEVGVRSSSDVQRREL